MIKGNGDIEPKATDGDSAETDSRSGRDWGFAIPRGFLLMRTFLNGAYNPNSQTRRTISLAAWSGIGVFLFILFFQPFDLPESRLTETLPLVAGMGLIVFSSIVVFLVVIPRAFPRWFLTGEWEEGPPDLLNFIVWLVSATGMAFYIRFVAGAPISIPLAVRVALTCLIPSVFVRVDMHITSLKRRIEAQSSSAISELPPQIRNVEIQSESAAETIRIPLDRLLYIKSADNYIEVFHREGSEIQSQLIRTTMKRACVDLSPFPRIIQCHRAYAVNMENIERLRKSPSGSVIEIRGVAEPIPVSRAYQIKVKEVLEG